MLIKHVGISAENHQQEDVHVSHEDVLYLNHMSSLQICSDDDAAFVIITPDMPNCSCLLDGGRAHEGKCMSVCLCVYQLSASRMCMTPEQADSHGSEVKIEPCLGFLADPNA